MANKITQITNQGVWIFETRQSIELAPNFDFERWLADMLFGYLIKIQGEQKSGITNNGE